MMNLKLDIVRVNEDVISTSACKDVYGVIQIYNENYFTAYTNGYDNGLGPNPQNGYRWEQGDKELANYTNQLGAYHFYLNSNGKIVICEECPNSENNEWEKVDNHDLHLSA